MKLLKKFAIGVLALLAVLALIVFIAEASFHRIGSQKLNEVSAQLDTEEPGWKLDQIEAVRQAAKPADDANPSIAVLELHAKIGAWWPRHRSSEDGSFGIPTNRQPAFSQLCWLLAARLETRDLRNAARERLLKPEYLARAGGYYPIEMKENPIVTLLPHAEKARAMASLLDYDARISTMEGDPERGIRSARAGARRREVHRRRTVPHLATRPNRLCESRGAVRTSGAGLERTEAGSRGTPGRIAR